jgi:heme exporter protein D
MDEWIEQGKAALQQAWQKIVDITLWFAKETEKAELDADPLLALVLALGLTFLLGSACWAASIAQARRHSVWLHFVLGLLLPWLYPLVILFAMGIKGEREMLAKREAEKRAREEREAERQRNIALNAPVEAGDEDDGGQAWKRSYFERIARDRDGKPAGPWDVQFNGAVLRIARIIEVQDELVLVEQVDARGQASRMRLPYAKIEAWNNVE